MNLKIVKINEYFFDVYDDNEEVGFFMLEPCEDAYPVFYSNNEEDLEYSASLTEFFINNNKRRMGYMKPISNIIENMAIQKGYDKIIFYMNSFDHSIDELKNISSKVGYKIYKDDYIVKEL